MPDTPYPGPQPADPAPAQTEAIQPAVNGAPSPPTHPAREPEPSRSAVGPSVKEWATYRLAQLAALGVLWVVLFFVLTVFGFKFLNAVILGAILSVVGSFFLRPLLPLPSPAERFRTEPERHPQPTDSFREVVETVVFVVVLVLMLKTFVAEAFVIPTGSMAETLYGYQKLITCPSCAYEFPVNCSAEVDPSEGPQTYVRGCTCPNCRKHIEIVPPVLRDGSPVDPKSLGDGQVLDPGWNSGDRVLVSKFVYDLPQRAPERLDVVVFKFPGDEKFPHASGPVKKHSPMNYIKRLIGLPGETVAIHRGKLYILPPEQSPRYDDVEKAAGDPDKLAQLWMARYMHHNDDAAVNLFKEGKFQIYRKPPAQVLSMMRLVYDNDHQADDLKGGANERWVPEKGSGWSAWEDKGGGVVGKAKRKHGFARSEGDGVGWLRYRHVLRGSDRPSLITDFMGYNTWEPHHGGNFPGENWASDLIVEAKAKVEAGSGPFILELSRGPDRFQASFDLGTGECTLYRVTGEDRKELGKAQTSLKGKGTYDVRFANVDDRLIVWVDGRLPFGDGVAYDAKRPVVPTKRNDLDGPVSIGATAGVAVSEIRVSRDTYYTTGRDGSPSKADVEFEPANAETFDSWKQAPVSTYYVQPDHFLCMGDNSPESSDGRSWGLVPRRLMLGRALLVYYPFHRAGRIR